MKFNLLTKFAAAAAITVSAAAMALPDYETARIYYSDASKTTAVGEKQVSLCGVGIVNVMVWGNTSPYYTNVQESCGGGTTIPDDEPIHCDRIRDIFCD